MTSLSLSYQTTQGANVLEFDAAVEETAGEAESDAASADALEEVQVETGGDDASADELVEFDPEAVGEAPNDD